MKYCILTFSMVLCSLATFAQDLSDKQIGFDIGRVTKSLKEHGVTDKDLNREIDMLRKMQQRQYTDMKKVEDDILRKIREEQTAKTATNRVSSTGKSAFVDIPQIEREALIAFYNSTGGPNWLNTVRNYGVWDINNPNSDVSTWYGVGVRDGHVVVLGRVEFENNIYDLSSNNLVGTIPSEIGNLTYLEGINLGGGDRTLTGELPSSIGNLKRLQYLNLSGNQFSGSIPSSIGNLTSLKSISLGQNQFSGSIPAEIGKLTDLTYLAIEYCQLTGSIPEEIGNLVNLKSLYLAENKLTGPLPKSIGALISLENLTLGDNELTGDIPKELGDLPLKYVILRNNHLSRLPTNLLHGSNGGGYLYFYNNRFRFKDFENRFSEAEQFLLCSPQENVDTETTISGIMNLSVTLKMCEDDYYIPDADTFQWYKGVYPNGELIAGATSRIFTISNLKATDSGDYYCLSKNPVYTRESDDPWINTYKNLILVRNPIHLTVKNCTPKTGTLKMPAAPLGVGQTANFSFEQTAGTAIPGEALSYKWTLADAAGQIVNSTTTTVGTHSFVFAADGKYTVNLVVTGADGCEATFSQELTIMAEKRCLNDSISFSFETTAPNLSYVWTARNAAGVVVNSSTASASSLYNVSFAIPGDYAVTMVATDTVTQCFETFTKNVTIEACASTNCMVHFNFNFKVPFIAKGGTLNNAERENIANGIIQFVNKNINEKLYLTTYDDNSTGVQAVAVQNDYTTLFPEATTNTSNETQGGFFRIQDDFYNDSFRNISNGIVANTAITKKIDVSFFVISEDNFADITASKAAYANLLNSAKTNKIFFIFLDEGRFRNRNTYLSPMEFASRVKGSSAINYTTTGNILTSDFISFSKAQIADLGFKNVLSEFLGKAFIQVKSKECQTSSCVTTNPNSQVVKGLFISLVNKLQSLPAGTVTNGYTCAELTALAPFITVSNPAIFNYNQGSFSFSSLPNNNDVLMTANAQVTDVNLESFVDSESATSFIAKYGTTEIGSSVKHINFCPDQLCPSTVGTLKSAPQVLNANVNASFSLETAATNLTYDWTFYALDNTTVLSKSTAAAATQSYTAAGTYRVVLNVKNDKGCITSFEKFVTVFPACTPITAVIKMSAGVAITPTPTPAPTPTPTPLPTRTYWFKSVGPKAAGVVEYIDGKGVQQSYTLPTGKIFSTAPCTQIIASRIVSRKQAVPCSPKR